ncbi:DUF2384 domain-containing protein [Kamptonema cortianum]|nr:DUF2384 domain-containing protein [Kamptonema cortianum]
MVGLAANAEINPKALSGAALRTFFEIAEAWRLSEHEQMRILGIDSPSALRNWKRGLVGSISSNTLERISCIFGIYEGLQILVPSSADDWVHKPNDAPLFGGKPALDLLASGKASDLILIRRYIDAQRV